MHVVKLVISILQSDIPILFISLNNEMSSKFPLNVRRNSINCTVEYNRIPILSQRQNIVYSISNETADHVASSFTYFIETNELSKQLF